MSLPQRQLRPPAGHARSPPRDGNVARGASNGGSERAWGPAKCEFREAFVCLCAVPSLLALLPGGMVYSGFRTLDDWNMRPLWTVIGRVDPRRFSTFAKGQGADSENADLFPRETMDDLPFPEGFSSLTVGATWLNRRFGKRRKGLRAAGVLDDGSTPSKYQRVNRLANADFGGEDTEERRNRYNAESGRSSKKKRRRRGGVRKKKKKFKRRTETSVRISSGSSCSSSGSSSSNSSGASSSSSESSIDSEREEDTTFMNQYRLGAPRDRDRDDKNSGDRGGHAESETDYKERLRKHVFLSHKFYNIPPRYKSSARASSSSSVMLSCSGT